MEETRKYASYKEYSVKIRERIETDQGNCTVTPLLLMLQGR